ncbi:MAG: exodeoxyribonuclease V subunit gamma [Myxococcales bacterium]|nr:exodeoxyribonuclease V subunit gamma [Myxococcales bacterium]
MLRAVHSNRAEALLAALLEALPPADPFAPATIVVGGHLAKRWLLREIAFARGIAAGLELVTFDSFVEHAWADPELGLSPVDRAQLVSLFASVLADPSVVRALPQVAAYLDEAPHDGDRAGPRRVQLAHHLARLTWGYASTRPDWMPALIGGHVPAELEGDPTARWQSKLIAAAFARASRTAEESGQRALVPMLPWARRRLHLPTPQLAGPVAVFGMPYLSRAQLEALTDLAQTTDVTVYVLDPCRELWDDVGGRKTAQDGTVTDPLPLVLWGKPVRDTLAALVERTGGDLEDRFVESAGDSARERLLADVQVRAAPASTASGEPGITVLACPNVRREIEAIAAESRRLLDADPALHANEICVWIAGDAARYLAQAPSAFEAVGVPCHLVDAPIDDRGRIAEAMLALLELPTSGMARRDLLRVMTHPAVLAGHPHVDAADWVRWTERLGVAHGADAAAHQGTYLEAFPGQFHWDQGVRRLALGAFMVGERSERGPVRIARLELAPEEVRPDEQASAATYALLVRSLCDDAAWLARREATLTEWAELFASLVDIYLASRDTDGTRDLERVRAMMAGLAHLDIDGRAIGFREAREHAIRKLASSTSNRGEPLAAGVMVAPISSMHALPFQVGFVAGLDEGAFPAGEQPSPLDLRREARPGDVSPRDRDRASFLEVLLGARRALYLSYVAVEAKSGQALGPSSVVLELADALAPYLGAPSSREALERIKRREPLHRFGGDTPGVVPAIARERWACGIRDHVRGHLRANNHNIPDENGLYALLSHASQTPLRAALGIVEPPAQTAIVATSRGLSISNLRTFLEYPVQAWAQAVLGLDELPDDDLTEHSDEPFHLDRPSRATLLRNVFAAHLADPRTPFAALYDRAVADEQLKGQFPVGVFAEAARAVDLAALDMWRHRLGPILEGSVVRYGFGRAYSAGAELMPPLAIQLLDGRTVRLAGQTELLIKRGDRHTSVVVLLGEAEEKSRYHLRGAFDHVVLAAAGLAPQGHQHVLLDPKGNALHVDHTPWTREGAQAHLATLINELLDVPHGYLLPFDALVRAHAGGRASFRDDERAIGFGPIDRADGLHAPDDPKAIAKRRFAPFVDRMRGDHGFREKEAKP